CFEKTVGLGKKNSSFLLNAILHCYTMLFVILGWVIFRSEGISNLLQYFNTMFGISKVDFINDNTILLFNENYIILIISIIASTPIYKIIGKKLCQRNIFSNYILPVCYFVLFLFSVASILKGNYNPFIYFNF
ncbi:MAG: AlgI, partial [Anaerocolumna sp.]|nr:AlgI [Anaerocolumna sp.]